MTRASLVTAAATVIALLAASPGSAHAGDPDLDALQATLDQSAAELDVAWMQSLVDHGQYDAALDALEGALASAAKIKAAQPRIVAIANAYAWSARAALAKGELDRAADFYRKALSAAKDSEAAEREVAYDARVGLGWIALAAGDKKTSVERFTEAGAFLDKQGRGSGSAATPHLLGLARAHLAAGDLAAAQRALDSARAAAGPSGEADVLRVQSLLSLASGDTPRARDSIARVFAIEDGGRLMREIATNPFEGHNLTTLGRLDGDLRISLSIARAAGDSDLAATKNALTAVLRRKGLVLEATAARHAAVQRRAAEEPALAERLSQLAELQRELAEMERKAPRGEAERAAYAKRIAEIEDSMDHRRSAISLHLPVGAGAEGAIRRVTAVTIEQIQAALPPDGALIEIARYAPVRARAASELERWDEPRYCAFLVRREGAPKLVDLGPADAIEGLIASFRMALASRKGAVAEPARALDALTMAKLRPHLSGVVRAWIAPDGALHTIPFEALIDEGGHYQVESLELTYLGTGRDLARPLAPASKLGPPMILANPAFTKSPAAGSSATGATSATGAAARGYDFSKAHFQELPGTAAEAQAIHASFPTSIVITREKVTRAAVTSLSRPLFLHIATHGFYLKKIEAPPQGGSAAGSRALELDGSPSEARYREPADPLVRSALALAGANGGEGVISALELSALDLAGTNLVVLSACETGLGDVASGEGVFGLRRAFAIAGAQTLVMSLWQVDDAATRTMMVGYYKSLRGGEGRSAAMRRVRLSMLEQRSTAHPYFWASFLVSGDAAPLTSLSAAPETAAGQASAPPPVSPSARGCACQLNTINMQDNSMLVLAALTTAAGLRARSARARRRRARSLR